MIVEKITKAGVFVRITDDYSEFIAKEELSVNKVLNAEDEVFVGEPISVVYYGKENDSIILSRKDICESKYLEDLYVKSLEDLLLTMGITPNKFVGKVVKINDAYFMTALMVVSEIGSPDNGKLLVDPITGLRIIVYVNNRLRNLVIEGRHYSVQLNLSFYDYRRKMARHICSVWILRILSRYVIPMNALYLNHSRSRRVRVQTRHLPIY